MWQKSKSRTAEIIRLLISIALLISFGWYILHGGDTYLIILAAILAAIVLCFLKQTSKLFFGMIEMAAAIAAIWYAAKQGRGAFSSAFSSGFQRFDLAIVQMIFVTQMAGAIYLLVDAIDNIWTSIKRNQDEARRSVPSEK